MTGGLCRIPLAAAAAAAFLAITSAAMADSLNVEVAATDAPLPEEVVVRVEPGDATCHVRRARQRGSCTLRVLEEGPWRVTATAPGFWAPAVGLDSLPGEGVRIALRPAGWLTASLAFADTAEEIAEIEVLAHSAQDGEADPLEVTCAVVGQRISRCTAPVGFWNLRLSAPGYVAHYYWGVRVEAEKERDLGMIELAPGASVFGRILRDDGSPASGADIFVRPVLDRSAAAVSGTADDAEQLTISDVANSWGYFFFDAIGPGRYDLRATERGSLPTPLHRFSVREDQKLELDEPLRLRRAAQLVLNVTPPEDEYGDPWTIEVRSDEALQESRILASGRTAEGRWRDDTLVPGPGALIIRDGRGTQVHTENLDLAPGRQSVDVELDLVIVRGRVAMGRNPLPRAHVVFHSPEQPTSIEMDADDDAEFVGVLPSPGAWNVEVSCRTPVVEARGIEIDVDPDPSGEASVDVEVPDTECGGEVVDDAGRPVPAAVVSLIHMKNGSAVASTTTDDSGRFEVHGLHEGALSVHASDGERESSQALVTLRENGPAPDVRLVLQSAWLLSGEVESSTGVVRDAVVLALPITAQRTIAVMALPDTRSAMDGRFDLRLPGAAAFARIFVLSPGFAFYIGSVVRDRVQHDGVSLLLDRQMGTIRLTTGATGSARTSSRGFPLVLIDGQPVDARMLAMWAAMNGGGSDGDVLTIPAMPPGIYSVCRLGLDEAMLVSTGAALPAARSCSDGGILSPGGVLRLEAP